MKAVHITRFGGPQSLELREAPDPAPQAGEVVIRVKAAGINFADILMRMGLYVGAPPVPFVPGYEIAGAVDALGPGVSGLKIGDRVFAALRFKGYSEKVVCAARQVLPIPAHKSFEEAAALPVNYLTAYHALYVLGNLRPGTRVLVHTAAGGVGLAAVELARLRGAAVIGTASGSKHSFLKEKGVAETIDYRTENFEKRVMELTSGKGVHIVLDPIGGSSFLKSYRCLAQGGLLVCYGLADQAGKDRSVLKALWSYLTSGVLSPLHMMLKNKGVTGFHLGLFDDDALMASEMAELYRLWSSGKIKPYVDRVFPAADAGDAHRYIQERRNIGKVLLGF